MTEYLSSDWSLWASRLANVCVVRNVILRSVLLKMFVMFVVSLPMYVKLANFCGVGSYKFTWFGGLCGFIGKELL
jgi:hypothetical protein